MPEEQKRYKLKCSLSALEMIISSVCCVVVIVLTAGIATPWCVYRIGQSLINHTELIEIKGRIGGYWS